MKVWSRHACHNETPAALSALADGLSDAEKNAQLVFAFYNCVHEAAPLHGFLSATFPDAAFIGGSSNGGVMLDDGLHDAGGVGLLIFNDPDGDFGVGAREKGAAPADAAEQALRDALESADCVDELPDMIWVYQSPGQEEAVIEGLRRIVGDRCPIIGGSSADNDLSGAWTQIAPAGTFTDAVVVAALFPSSGVSYAFQGGYEPNGRFGVASQVADASGANDGQAPGRIIRQIDGRPAAAVYNEWIEGGIDDVLDEGGVILGHTTSHPIALEAGVADGVEQYVLVHPERVLPDGSLTTFANIPPDATLHCMTGDESKLVDRAGRVAEQAVAQLDGTSAAAGLIVYCAGCRMKIGEQVAALPETVRSALGNIPFLGCFTFGEQGAIVDKNAHGNLMISVVAFGG